MIFNRQFKSRAESVCEEVLLGCLPPHIEIYKKRRPGIQSAQS